jgi:hypothetical protein
VTGLFTPADRDVLSEISFNLVATRNPGCDLEVMRESLRVIDFPPPQKLPWRGASLMMMLMELNGLKDFLISLIDEPKKRWSRQGSAVGLRIR